MSAISPTTPRSPSRCISTTSPSHRSFQSPVSLPLSAPRSVMRFAIPSSCAAPPPQASWPTGLSSPASASSNLAARATCTSSGFPAPSPAMLLRLNRVSSGGLSRRSRALQRRPIVPAAHRRSRNAPPSVRARRPHAESPTCVHPDVAHSAAPGPRSSPRPIPADE